MVRLIRPCVLISKVIGCIQGICFVFCLMWCLISRPFLKKVHKKQSLMCLPAASVDVYFSVCDKQLFLCTCVCVCVFRRKAMAQLTDVTLHTHSHTYKPVATRLLLPRRPINAVRTQCQSNVFVYLSSESLAPPEHPDRQTPSSSPHPSTTSPSSPPTPPALSFHNWSGGGCVPWGVKTWQLFFSSPLIFFTASLSLSLSLVFSCLLRISMY